MPGRSDLAIGRQNRGLPALLRALRAPLLSASSTSLGSFLFYTPWPWDPIQHERVSPTANDAQGVEGLRRGERL